MDHEQTARANHRRGMSCADSVYQAFSDLNARMTAAPVPRSEGGKCGAVLAAEKVLRETGAGSIDEFERRFTGRFGSLKCSELLGKRRGACNDFVGTASAIAEELITSKR